MWTKRILPLLLATILILAGCTPVVTSPPTTLPATPDIPVTPDVPPTPSTGEQQPSAQAQAVAQADNSFGFDLLQQIYAESPDENIFISPLSIALLLQMLHSGAGGETATEIAQVLYVDDLDPATLSSGVTHLQAMLQATPDIELLIANSLWAQEGLELRDAFRNQMQDEFDAENFTVDFTDPATAEVIAAWIEEATQGKITDFLVELDPATVLLLANAIYFKGDWQQPFDRDATQEHPFTLPDGRQIQVPMMQQTGSFPFYQEADFAAVALPYGDGQMRMVILLPSPGVEDATFWSTLDETRWQTVLDELSEQRIQLGLPRFRAEYEESLNDFLQALGMEQAFGAADFSPMTPTAGIFLSEVRHKAIVEVNEEGTVAAAATIGIMPTSMPPELMVDRPFFMAIHDSASDAILFMGIIQAPEELEE
jgi:serine protease inhibitor